MLHNRDKSVHREGLPFVNLWGKDRRKITQFARIDKECQLMDNRGLGVDGSKLDIHGMNVIYTIKN